MGCKYWRKYSKPNGSYDYYKGLDCSGFVSWAMHAANITGTYTAAGFLSLGDHIPFSKLSPGDVIANSGHVILVLEILVHNLKLPNPLEAEFNIEPMDMTNQHTILASQ